MLSLSRPLSVQVPPAGIEKDAEGEPVSQVCDGVSRVPCRAERKEGRL